MSLFVTMSGTAGQADQRARPVVVLHCEADLDLCRTLVLVLAEAAPGQIYRINPNPRPPQAFDIKIDLNGQAQARLSWSAHDGGGEHAATNRQSEKVARAGMSDMDLSRALLEVSPDLIRALHNHKSN